MLRKVSDLEIVIYGFQLICFRLFILYQSQTDKQILKVSEFNQLGKSFKFYPHSFSGFPL